MWLIPKKGGVCVLPAGLRLQPVSQLPAAPQILLSALLSPSSTSSSNQLKFPNSIQTLLQKVVPYKVSLPVAEGGTR